MCFEATGRLQGGASKLLRARWQSPGILRIRCKFALQLTARQYGEVVLPDAASGNCPGTPRQRGQKVVTVQGGYGALFVVQVQSLLSITRVAVQV